MQKNLKFERKMLFEKKINSSGERKTQTLYISLFKIRKQEATTTTYNQQMAKSEVREALFHRKAKICIIVQLGSIAMKISRPLGCSGIILYLFIMSIAYLLFTCGD